LTEDGAYIKIHSCRDKWIASGNLCEKILPKGGSENVQARDVNRSSICDEHDDVHGLRILAWSDRRLVGLCAQATGIPKKGIPVFHFIYQYHFYQYHHTGGMQHEQ
jgi:hypothetical protein